MIDADFLLDKFASEDCICALCWNVLVEPTMGGGCSHLFCWSCYVKWLCKTRECPSCRQQVENKSKLVRILNMDGMISRLEMRCIHSAKEAAEAAPPASGEQAHEAGAGPPAAKRPRHAPAASMSLKALHDELLQRGLETAGRRPELVARLEEGRKKGVALPRRLAPADSMAVEALQDEKCGWKGRVGELVAHLGTCEWAPVECRNKGCTESPLRKDLPEHGATCGGHKVRCRHCRWPMERRLLADHESICQLAEIKCPNEGCHAERAREDMHEHRMVCDHEQIACIFRGCGARLLRFKMNAHVTGGHMAAAAEMLQALAFDKATLERTVAALKAKDVQEDAARASEQRHLQATPTTRTFNWRAESSVGCANGWGLGDFVSETCDLGESVVGSCALYPTIDPGHSHSFGVAFEGRAKFRVHATFSVLDKNDKALPRTVQLGTADKPHQIKAGKFVGEDFTPTEEEKAQSVREDGSIRLRAVVRLFLD